MLVIISDLHFEEETSRNIAQIGSHEAIEVPRNIPVAAFRKILTKLHEQAQQDGAAKIDLVLAGDIFDLNRTALWFQDNDNDVRPYGNNNDIQPGSALEKKVLDILAATDKGEVHAILQAFRNLVEKGSYIDAEQQPQQIMRSYVDAGGRTRVGQMPVEIQYIPGNHDRLANATPAIRSKVRELLGVKGGKAPFPQKLIFPDERALIRHGHEYDYYNFSQDLRGKKPIGLELPQAYYDAPCFGDFVTVDIVSRISEAFRSLYGDERVLADPLLRQLYKRALEFDDLRPLRAVFNYLLNIPQDLRIAGEDYGPAHLWREHVRPVIKQLRDDLHGQEKKRGWLRQLAQGKGFDPLILLVRLALWLPFWNLIPYWLVKYFSTRGMKSYQNEKSKAFYAEREESLRSGQHLFLVAGHTHRPTVDLIGRAADGEQYYVDTGTWRWRIPASPDLTTFGRIKTLSYAVIYGPQEDLGDPPVSQKLVSLDHWAGLTKRWSADD